MLKQSQSFSDLPSFLNSDLRLPQLSFKKWEKENFIWAVNIDLYFLSNWVDRSTGRDN